MARHLASWRGSTVEVVGPDDAVAQVVAQLPPFYGTGGEPHTTATLVERDGIITLELADDLAVSGPPGAEIFRAAASRIELVLVDRLSELTAVHAGVVATEDGVILLPGSSMAGKSTLTQELVRQGATYLSDEFALVTPEGTVLPYPRAMTMRTTSGSVRDLPPLAARVGDPARPVRLVGVLQFSPEGWDARDLSPGEATMALIANCVNVRREPARALTALTALAESARALSGTRGEAAETAERLLSRST